MLSISLWTRGLLFLIGVVTLYVLVPFRKWLEYLHSYSLIVVISGISNLLFIHYGRTILFEWGHYRFTLESFIYGISFGIMLASMIMWLVISSFFLKSQQILSLFKGISNKLGLVLSMLVQTITMYQQQKKNISESYYTLGLTSKNKLSGIKKEGLILVTLFGWALEQSMVRSDSMLARGYGGSKRTSYLLEKWSKKDSFFLIVIIILTLLIGYFKSLGTFKMIYYPRVKGDILTTSHLLGYMLLILYSLLPLIVMIWEEYKWR